MPERTRRIGRRHAPTGQVGPNRRGATGVGYAVLAAAVIAAALASVLSWTGAWDPLWELFSGRERTRLFVDGAGPWAPAAYLALLVAQAVVAPLPAAALAVAGGFAFGLLEGFLLAWLGATLGSMACFGLARALGRKFVARGGRARTLDRYAEEHGAWLIFFLRLMPFLSSDAISYAAGLSGMAFWRFLLATVLGSAPGTFLYVYLGGADAGTGTHVALLGTIFLLAAASFLYLRRKRRTSR